MITPKQIRAARGLLHWSQKDLAAMAGLNAVTILQLEHARIPINARLSKSIQSALISAGVYFFGVDGVGLSEGEIKVYQGPLEFKRFYDELYIKFALLGGVARVSNVREEDFIKCLGEDYANIHVDRVMSLGIEVRVLVDKITSNVRLPHASYKEIPREFFMGITPCYIYHDTISHILWDEATPEEVRVISIKNNELARSQALQFELIWNKGGINDAQ